MPLTTDLKKTSRRAKRDLAFCQLFLQGTGVDQRA
jgi:hypothetical protein